MSFLANFLQDWFLSVRVFIHDLRENNLIIYITMIALLLILICVSVKFIARYFVNVNVYRRNVAVPIVILIFSTALLILILAI